MKDMYYVLTYGTLKKGQYNHSYMDSAKGQFVENVITSESKYQMIDVNHSFPGIIKGNHKFKGELYIVPLEGIQYYLDYLEGYPTMYTRIITEVEGIETKKKYKALVYVLTSEFIKYNSGILSEKSKNISLEDDAYNWL